MGKSHKKGSGRGSLIQAKTKDGSVEWTPKMTMNMSDLSRDDDFLNHLLVEKLGTANIPLYVHKMDPMRPLPKTDPKDLISIVQRVSFLGSCVCMPAGMLIDAFGRVLPAHCFQGARSKSHQASGRRASQVWPCHFLSSTTSLIFVAHRLHAVRTFIKKFSQLQIDAFATYVYIPCPPVCFH